MPRVIRVQKGHAPHIDFARSMRRGDRHCSFYIVYRDPHVARKKVSGSDRYNAECVCCSRHRACSGAYRAVAAACNNNIRIIAFKGFFCTDIAVFIKFRINKNFVGYAMAFTIPFYICPGCAGLWF